MTPIEIVVRQEIGWVDPEAVDSLERVPPVFWRRHLRRWAARRRRHVCTVDSLPDREAPRSVEDVMREVLEAVPLEDLPLARRILSGESWDDLTRGTPRHTVRRVKQLLAEGVMG